MKNLSRRLCIQIDACFMHCAMRQTRVYSLYMHNVVLGQDAGVGRSKPCAALSVRRQLPTLTWGQGYVDVKQPACCQSTA